MIFHRPDYTKLWRRRYRIAILLILMFTSSLIIPNTFNKVSAYNVYQDNSVDADSNIDAVGNIGDDGATSYLDAQTINAVDQAIVEGNGAGYVAGINNENDIDNDASNVDGVNDIGTQGTFSNAQGTEADTTYMNIQEGTGAGYVAGSDEDELHDAITDTDSGTNPDTGTYSNDANMQSDDGTMNILTEENTGGGGVDEWIAVDGIDGSVLWTPTGSSPYIDIQDQPTNLISTGTNGLISQWYTFGSTSGTGTGFTVNASIYDINDGDGYAQWEVDWTGDGTADASGNFASQGSYGWQNTGTISGLDTDTEINAARIRFTNNKGAGGPNTDTIDAARLGVSQAGGDNYEFDREFQFNTIATLDGDTESLDINTGIIGTESLIVQIWEASSWTTVVTIVDANDNTWINTSIATWMDATTEYFRFLGGTETTDTTLNTWEIDMVLIHNIKNEVLDYELNFEYQWTTADTGQTNEEVSIWVGPRSDAENIVVDYWSGTWTNIGTINAASTHFNFTATGIATTYTLRFTGSSETGDSTQTDWDIDLITLHTWTTEVLDYELQWEHQAQTMDVHKDTYNITIYGSATEDINIQTWDIGGTAWNTPLSLQISTTEKWYNITVDANSIGDSITWRYIGTAETGDTVQSTLNIDYAGIAAWNFTMDIIEATFSIANYNPGSGKQLIDGTLRVNTSAGVDYDIQIKGADGTGTPITNGWVYWDTDSDPAGATLLTLAFVDFLTSQPAGDKLIINIYIFLDVPFGEDDGVLTMTLTIQIIKA